MKKIIVLIQFIVFVNVCSQDNTFKKELGADTCIFSTTGNNKYFILEPGYRLVLQGAEDEDTARIVITVLNETRFVNGTETRVVEENESKNGVTKEISRNFFAYCNQTGSIYYFGEDVDYYKNGKVTAHSGSWLAEGDNRPGVIMPGEIIIGDKYYQEISPGKAMDRAENISTTETFETPAGRFTNVLKVRETSQLEPDEKEYKLYAPGIGLIKDEELVLISYGFVK